MFKNQLLLTGCLGLLMGCGAPSGQTPTLEPTASPISTPTQNPDLPTQTDTVLPSPTPTSTAVETATPSEIPTPTAEYTPTEIPTPAPEDAIYYDPDHVIEVAITMDEDDFAELSLQQRYWIDLVKGEDCMDQPNPSPYTWFEADVVIDGTLVETVGIRKKGFFGSSSTSKPGLKLKFDKYIEDQELAGMERMTLNNGVQDPSLIHQCMAYQILDDAGIPSPRCNYARVTLNGDYLGVYVHVEALKKSFLKRHYSDNDGDLYEGAISDFRDDWLNTFQPKTSDTDPELGPIWDLTNALKVGDAQLLDSLDGILDVDAYLTYWAGEVLVAQWDGYASNTNNFLIYKNPDDDLITFIPWGMDGSMNLGSLGRSTPVAVYAGAVLPNRLYGLPDMRQAYYERLELLLDIAWDEEALLAETERMEDLLLAHVTNPDEFQDAVKDVQRFIRERRDLLMEEINMGGMDIEEGPNESFCWPNVGTVDGEFSGNWNTLGATEPLTTGSSSLSFAWPDHNNPVINGGAIIGQDDDVARIEFNALGMDTEVYKSYILLPEEWLLPGENLLDGYNAFGVVEYTDARSGLTRPVAIFLDGELILTEASRDDGAPISGTFTGELYAL